MSSPYVCINALHVYAQSNLVLAILIPTAAITPPLSTATQLTFTEDKRVWQDALRLCQLQAQ